MAIAAGSATAQTVAEEPFTPLNRRVESSDLPPALLPLDLWRGLDAAALQKWVAGQDAPPRSPALHRLWRRMLLSAATPPADQNAADELLRLRLEALYRSGLLSDIADVLGKGGAPDATVQLWRARVDIGLDKRNEGCKALAGLGDAQLAKPLRAEKQLLLGYCAAVAGDTRAAGLAASLAREEGSTDELALTVLGSLDGGIAGRPALPARLSLTDYRFLELTGPIDGAQALPKAEPALLVALAGASTRDVKVQVAAAEAALHLNALTPEAAADVYRRLPAATGRGSGGASPDPALQRAQLFRAIEAAQAPEHKARLVRTLLGEARRSKLHLQAARMLAPLFAGLWPSPEASPLAEAVVQVALAAEDLEPARRWAESAASLQHWLALIDLADPQARQVQASALVYLDDLAKRGRMGPAQLHRAVTVLDALDADVPLRLWESAGRVAQPSGGHLPATGVLAELAQASQQKEAGRTILLVMRALGPDGPDGANVLALADALRALKRAGLEADARRLAVEALFADWPRTSGS
ncbi:MAG TPA: hypothetical protein VH741_04115 [Candidatus Limnocylindrales bacterium]